MQAVIAETDIGLVVAVSSAALARRPCTFAKKQVILLMLRERTEIHGSDAELESQFSGSIETGFDSLIEKTRETLTSFLYRLMPGRLTIEDLGQEVFVQAYGSRQTRVTGTEFIVSLYRIAIALGRRNTVEKHPKLAAKVAKLAAFPPAAPLPRPAANIRQCIEDLPEQQCIALFAP